jgi:hypothetical protein
MIRRLCVVAFVLSLLGVTAGVSVTAGAHRAAVHHATVADNMCLGDTSPQGRQTYIVCVFY